jgi:UDP-3-O-[3-hydroxymyristoyl] glucosamine N-acyltransferase
LRLSVGSVPARRWADSPIEAGWVIAVDSVIEAGWVIAADSVIVAESVIVADSANEENLAPEAKTEGNVFNRRPTIVGNRGTIGLAKIRTG